MDGLRDDEEEGYDPLTNPDPHGDNFSFEGTVGGTVPVDQVDYSKINGPEENATDPDQNRRPDTEDLDNSGYLEQQNDYFSFVVNLSPDHEDTVFVAGGDQEQINWGSPASWRMYRIPLDTIAFPAAGDPAVSTGGGSAEHNSVSSSDLSMVVNQAYDGSVVCRVWL